MAGASSLVPSGVSESDVDAEGDSEEGAAGCKLSIMIGEDVSRQGHVDNDAARQQILKNAPIFVQFRFQCLETDEMST